MNDVKDVLNDLLSRFENLAKTKTVIGDPMEIKGKTIVPLIEVGIGAGGGGGGGESGGEHEKGGVGSGGGLRVKPTAVLLIDDSGMSVYGIEKQGGMSKFADIMPEMLEKFSKIRGERPIKAH